MRKSKKLIALLCAMVMIFSAFGVFSLVASAEDAGIVLTAVPNEDYTGAEITVKYVGYDTGIASYCVSINLPEEVTDIPECVENPAAMAAANKLLGSTGVGNFKKDEHKYIYNAAGALDTQCTDGIFLVFNVKFAEALKKPLKIELNSDSFINTVEGGKKYVGAENGLPSAEVTLTNPNVPSEPPTLAPIPTDETKPPKQSDAPADATPTAKPTNEPITDKGIVLTAVPKEDYTGAEITVKYVGYDTGIASYCVSINLPDEVINVPECVENPAAMAAANKLLGSTGVGNFKKDEHKYIYNAAGALDTQCTDGIFLVFNVEFDKPITEDVMIALNSDSFINTVEGGKKYVGAEDGLPNAFVLVEAPTGGDVPTETPVPAEKVATGNLKDTINDSAKQLLDEADPNDDITVAVTIEPASQNFKYGSDYKAFYNGKELTEAEYNNYLNGYVEGVTIEDVINGMTYEFYNKNITGLKTQLKNWTKGTQSTPGDATPVTPVETVTPTPTAPSTSGTPTPTATATPSGSGSGSGSGGGSGSGSGGNIYWGGGNGGPGGSNIYGGPTSGTNQGGVSGTQFTDVDPTRHAWAVPAINYLVAKGVVCGRTPQLFDPDATVTRAEFTKMVVGAIGLTPAGVPSFADAANHWAASFIATAEQRGIVTGYSADQFAPDKKISRQEMAAIVYRAATAVGKALPAGTLAFADANLIDDYAKAPCAALQAAGIIQGVGNNMFDPLGNATRAQSAVIVYNYMTK